MEQKVRKVLIGTPAHDGRLDVWYTDSVVNSVRLCQANGIFLHPIYLSYDALIQRARNDVIRLALEEEYDDLIFIDSDLQWDPQWILDLLKYEEDVVGGTYRKKTDEFEMYVVKTKNIEPAENGLIKVEGLGTGFVKMSNKALRSIWNVSQEYTNEGKVCRMCCDLQIVDGELFSEDTVLFKKLTEAGYDIWLDPKMTCVHIGSKKFFGDVQDFFKRVKEQN
jgi:glycosyltransferase involved in cell wall biosynthesis